VREVTDNDVVFDNGACIDERPTAHLGTCIYDSCGQDD
jgi:hypothetical protein